jgi:hypothetical protein
MTPFLRYIALPAIEPILFFGVAATPVDVLGCKTRGLLAVIIAFASVLGGLASATMALKGRLRGDWQSHWWVGSELVHAIPAIGLIILA